jgi:hypothetical protein
LPARKSRLEFWAQIAGLAATAWVVWAASIAPQWSRGRGWRIFADAGTVALWALGWSLAMALTLRRIARRPAEAGGETVGAAAAAAWFAPAVILLAQFTPVGIAGGLALVVNATRMLCVTGWAAIGERHARNLALAVAASAGLQMAAVFYSAEWRARSAALLALGVALVTALAVGRELWGAKSAPNLPRSFVGLCLTLLLALMIGRGTGGVGWGFGWGFGAGAGESEESAQTETPGSGDANEAADRRDEFSEGGDGDYWGVILWPELKPVTMLVAPPAPGGGITSASTRPLSIPFGGEYWMYRHPFRRPPSRSHFQRGDPARLFFTTTDRKPLQMEARHKLEQPIAASCCSAMLVEIRNADRHPGTIGLEVILLEASAGAESLGVEPVRSAPDLKLERPRAVAETLAFPFPASTGIERFDEIRVVFHRSPARASKSARVAIERFVLKPRT